MSACNFPPTSITSLRLPEDRRFIPPTEVTERQSRLDAGVEPALLTSLYTRQSDTRAELCLQAKIGPTAEKLGESPDVITVQIWQRVFRHMMSHYVDLPCVDDIMNLEQVEDPFPTDEILPALETAHYLPFFASRTHLHALLRPDEIRLTDPFPQITRKNEDGSDVLLRIGRRTVDASVHFENLSASTPDTQVIESALHAFAGEMGDATWRIFERLVDQYGYTWPKEKTFFEKVQEYYGVTPKEKSFFEKVKEYFERDERYRGWTESAWVDDLGKDPIVLAWRQRLFGEAMQKAQEEYLRRLRGEDEAG